MKNSKQAFFGLFGLTIILIAATIGLTYAGLGMLQKKGDDLVKLKEEQQVLKNRQDALVSANRDIKDYSEFEKISKAIVPQEKDQARTVREILAIADQSGVPLETVQLPASTLGAKKSTSSKTSSDPDKTQLLAVPGTQGLYTMEITVQSASKQPVPYSRILTFLEKLEQNRRTAHVTNISIQPEKDNRNLMTFTIMLNVYIKPGN
jgi:hypothetical protein